MNMKERIIEEVKERLNKLTILEFKENYNKSEIQRIVKNYQTEEYKKIVEEIKEKMSQIYNSDEYSIRVASSYVSINKVLERTKFGTSEQEYEKIWSDNFKILPYGYVMGKKVSKKVMEETIKMM